MNILYLEHYAGSPEMGMEFRPYYLSREWVKAGHSVRIVAGDYSHLRRKNPAVEHDWTDEEINGITYTWIRTGAYSGNGVTRALTMFRFVRKLWTRAGKIAREWKPDVVITSSTYPLDSYAGVRIARKAHAKYIHEEHDMWPSTLYEVGGMSKHHPFVLLMQIGENYTYKHCDKIVALHSHAEPYMREHGLAPGKYVNIQNGVVEEEWENPLPLPEEHEAFFEDVRGQGKFVVGYFGGHAVSNALDLMLDAAKSMRGDESLLFVLVGDGVEKPRLMKRAEEEGISNVRFLPSVPKRSVPSLLKKFDCVYITGQTSPLYRFGLSLNKIYDTMMAGVPLVCSFDAPDMLVEKYACGIGCDPAKPETVIGAIKKIRGMTAEERKAMGERGHRAILDGFTYRQLAAKFLQVMQE